MDHKRPAKLSIERNEDGYTVTAKGTPADLCMLFGMLGANLIRKGVPIGKLVRMIHAADALGLVDNAVGIDLAALRSQLSKD